MTLKLKIISFFFFLYLCYRISSNKFWISQTEIEDGCTSKRCLKGINPDILLAFQNVMNFTYMIKLSHYPGTRLENGTWSDQIGTYIFYKQIDDKLQSNFDYMYT